MEEKVHEVTRRDGIKLMGAGVLVPMFKVDPAHIILVGDTNTDPLTNASGVNLSAS